MQQLREEYGDYLARIAALPTGNLAQWIAHYKIGGKDRIPDADSYTIGMAIRAAKEVDGLLQDGDRGVAEHILPVQRLTTETPADVAGRVVGELRKELSQTKTLVADLTQRITGIQKGIAKIADGIASGMIELREEALDLLMAARSD